ncbi:transcriptional regulator [Cupriavidus sp. CP313]
MSVVLQFTQRFLFTAVMASASACVGKFRGRLRSATARPRPILSNRRAPQQAVVTASLRGMQQEMKGNVFTRDQLDAYFSSYVGMDGGNPAAAVWICDPAPATAGSPLAAPLAPAHVPQAWDANFRAVHARDMARWQTHQRIARIMSAAREMVLSGQHDQGDWQRYLAEYLYRARGWEFKLSLFPLPMRPDRGPPWKQLYGMQPELKRKDNYLALCRDGGRFRFIETLRKCHRPKVVVCLGERHEADYLHAFGMRGLPCTEHVLKPADQTRMLRVYQDQGTHLVVCPAVAGAAGLASDVLLNAMGRFISQWLTMADFPMLPEEPDRHPRNRPKSWFDGDHAPRQNLPHAIFAVQSEGTSALRFEWTAAALT